MIEVKGRSLLINENERSIGCVADNEVETRKFLFHDDTIAKFSFKLELENNEYVDIVDLEKEDCETGIVLTWKITSRHTQYSGNLKAQLRAFSASGEVWHSDIALFQVNKSINAATSYPPVLPSEFEQLEARVQILSDNADNSAQKAKIHSENAAESATGSASNAQTAVTASESAFKSAASAEQSAILAKEAAESIKANVNKNTVANALIGNAKGEAVGITDISPIEHELSVKVSGVEDITKVNVLKSGGNLLDIEGREVVNFGATSNTSKRTFTGKGIIKGFAYNNYYQPTNVTSFEKNKNGFSFSNKEGTKPYGIGFEFKAMPNVTYVARYEGIEDTTGSTIFLTEYDKDGNMLRYTMPKATAGKRARYFVTGDKTEWVVISIQNTVEETVVSYNNVYVGIDAFTEYEPYIEPESEDVSLTELNEQGKISLYDPFGSFEIAENSITGIGTATINTSGYVEFTATSIASFKGATIVVDGAEIPYTSEETEDGFYLITTFEFKGNVIESIVIETDTCSVTFDRFVKTKSYGVNADGTVEGITSLYPSTTLITDTVGAVIDVEYNRDLNKAFAEVIQAIISLGGNV